MKVFGEASDGAHDRHGGQAAHGTQRAIGHGHAQVFQQRQIVLAIVTREEEDPSFADERDKLIELKGTAYQFAIFGTGFFLAMGAMALGQPPEVMFGKVMSIPDKVMDVYAKLVTPWKPAEIHAFEADLKAGRIHPRDAKMKLAWAITSAFYGASGANAAQNQFVALFQKGNTPDEMPEYLTDCRETLLEIMVSNGLAGSKSQARRLIDQQGVKLDGATVDDGNLIVNHECIIQVGKRHFLKVAIKK